MPSSCDEPLVLVVDDDPAMRLLMREALHQAGFAVEEAEDGMAALAAVNRRQPDAVLLDVLMPGMDGFAALAELRKRPESRGLPVSMVTGLDDTDSIRRAFAAGATDFITKPINWTTLGYHVDYLLRASRAFAELQKSRAYFNAILEDIPLLVCRWTADGTIRFVNEAYCRFFGKTAEELVGNSFLPLIPEEDREKLQEHIASIGLDAPVAINENRAIRSDGEVRWQRWTNRALFDGEGNIIEFQSIGDDITEQKATEEQLRRLALFDPLTGLANRVLLHDRLQQTLYEADRDQTQAALLMLDLDNFKDINDTLGHPCGDRVLAQVGARLRERTRHSDTIARMGGDEFVIVLRNIAGSEKVGAVTQEIFESLSQPYLLEDSRVYVTASLGIALYPVDGRDTDDLIRKADTAMYHAKGRGKNRYQFYTAEMNRRAQERLTLQTDLRRALERDEFIVYYQPKIDLKTAEVTGVEALLRWQKPEGGLVPPASFIPLAEETGLIVPIGEKVLQLVCAQVKSWQLRGIPHLSVAVNLSAIQLREEKLASTVAKILAEAGLDPGALELEITESAIMQETENAIALLHAIRDMGIRVTMDDFGTGYSSLSYLKRFPISSLKIDRSFIAEVLSNADDAEIIRAIIAMAHRMNLKVVAEGVETAEQLEFLRGEGCNEAQGYYFAHPMPAEEFYRWFQSRTAAAPV